MDEHTTKAFVNRDDPIPVIQIPRLDYEEIPPTDVVEQQKLGKRERIKKEADRLKGKLQDVSAQYKSTQGSVQERLFNTCVNSACAMGSRADGDN